MSSQQNACLHRTSKKMWIFFVTANLLHYKDFILSEKFHDCVYFKSFKLCL